MYPSNEKKLGSSAAKSSLKVNEAAKTIQCTICRQTYLCTSKVPAYQTGLRIAQTWMFYLQEPELRQHHESKHGKNTFAECFPGFGAAAAE